MTITTIGVCDDNPSLANGWVDEIRSATDEKTNVSRVDNPGDEFRKLLDRIPLPTGDETSTAHDTAFDACDVLVVDYDLVEIDVKQARHTGEGFARMARLYSDCNFIIVMNQFAVDATFDLELVGHLSSFADLNIDSQLIGKKSLWGGERDGNEFAPWHWPNIAKAIASRKGLVQKLQEGLDKPLLEVIEFPADLLADLSDLAAGFLFPPAKKAEPESLPDAASAANGIVSTATLREILEASNEHREISRAIQSNPHRAAKAAVARVAKWYARAVLGPQDLLVDVPHLLQRMPFLLHEEFGDPKDPNTWNRAIVAGRKALIPEVEHAFFEPGNRWLGLDAFWWPKIANSEAIKELRSDFEPENYADLVFAEDASVFIPFDEATPFRAGFHNQFDVRYIKFFEGINYGPSRRLAAV